MNLEFDDVVKSVNNFSPSCEIGHGGYGTVYKAVLWGGTVVAVKRLGADHKLPTAFRNECALLTKYRHPNIVTLFGGVEKNNERLLVYEFMSHGSLEARLKTRPESLSWRGRGICRGLLYLHNAGALAVIHRDTKSSNILLDDVDKPKIADFGLARQMPRDRSFIFSQPTGTLAYIDPEYLSTGQLTPASDVYSFGIILLELLTGRPAIGLKKAVLDELDVQKSIAGLLDPRVPGNPFFDELEQIGQIALMCLEERAKRRPSVSWLLERLSAILDAMSRARHSSRQQHQQQQQQQQMLPSPSVSQSHQQQQQQQQQQLPPPSDSVIRGFPPLKDADDLRRDLFDANRAAQQQQQQQQQQLLKSPRQQYAATTTIIQRDYFPATPSNNDNNNNDNNNNNNINSNNQEQIENGSFSRVNNSIPADVVSSSNFNSGRSAKGSAAAPTTTPGGVEVTPPVKYGEQTRMPTERYFFGNENDGGKEKKDPISQVDSDASNPFRSPRGGFVPPTPGSTLLPSGIIVGRPITSTMESAASSSRQVVNENSSSSNSSSNNHRSNSDNNAPLQRSNSDGKLSADRLEAEYAKWQKGQFKAISGISDSENDFGEKTLFSPVDSKTNSAMNPSAGATTATSTAVVLSPRNRVLGADAAVAPLGGTPRTTKVCMRCNKNPLVVRVLPCEHLVACKICAPQLLNCILCRTPVVGYSSDPYYQPKRTFSPAEEKPQIEQQQTPRDNENDLRRRQLQQQLDEAAASAASAAAAAAAAAEMNSRRRVESTTTTTTTTTNGATYSSQQQQQQQQYIQSQFSGQAFLSRPGTQQNQQNQQHQQQVLLPSMSASLDSATSSMMYRQQIQQPPQPQQQIQQQLRSLLPPGTTANGIPTFDSQQQQMYAAAQWQQQISPRQVQQPLPPQQQQQQQQQPQLSSYSIPQAVFGNQQQQPSQYTLQQGQISSNAFGANGGHYYAPVAQRAPSQHQQQQQQQQQAYPGLGMPTTSNGKLTAASGIAAVMGAMQTWDQRFRQQQQQPQAQPAQPHQLVPKFYSSSSRSYNRNPSASVPSDMANFAAPMALTSVPASQTISSLGFSSNSIVNSSSGSNSNNGGYLQQQQQHQQQQLPQPYEFSYQSLMPQQYPGPVSRSLPRLPTFHPFSDSAPAAAPPPPPAPVSTGGLSNNFFADKKYFSAPGSPRGSSGAAFSTTAGPLVAPPPSLPWKIAGASEVGWPPGPSSSSQGRFIGMSNNNNPGPSIADSYATAASLQMFQQQSQSTNRPLHRSFDAVGYGHVPPFYG